MAFTDVEMAILSQAAYYHLPDGGVCQSLYSFLDENLTKLKTDLGKEYEVAIDKLMKKLKADEWAYTIVQTENDANHTGFAAMAIAGPDNDVTVVCRGTEGFELDYNSIQDMYADLRLVDSLQTAQQREMMRFMKKLQEGGYDAYYFTGHSLGGNLAMYGAICLDDPSQLGEVVTFNAPGFNAKFMAFYNKQLKEIEDRFVNYQNERDCVSEAFTVPGEIVILERKGKDEDDIWGISSHSLNAFVINDEDGSFVREESGKKDPTIIGVVLQYGTIVTDLYFHKKAVLINFVVYVWDKLKEWAKSISAGASYSKENPLVILDTYKLGYYGDRLNSINSRLSNLDTRIDNLYKKVEWGDLWDLMRSDCNISWSYRLSRCASYLKETAAEFAAVERDLTNKLY